MFANSYCQSYGLVILLVLSCLLTYAQKKVTGNVQDANNQPTSGATVTVTGTRDATQTDLTGNFSITVPQGRNSLTISYVGNEDQLVDVTNLANINVKLKSVNNPLEGVVVIGYGTQKRSDVTGAIGSVTAKDIQDEPVIQVGQALQGKITGLQVSQNSGAPGSGLIDTCPGIQVPSIMRNHYMLSMGILMLIPLDLAPDQIESIQVLKSASAAAIYGAQGANGVF